METNISIKVNVIGNIWQPGIGVCGAVLQLPPSAEGYDFAESDVDVIRYVETEVLPLDKQGGDFSQIIDWQVMKKVEFVTKTESRSTVRCIKNWDDKKSSGKFLKTQRHA